MNAQHPRDDAGTRPSASLAPLIVVLDEDDDARRIAETWLQTNGMRVLSAPDPESAAASLDGRRADVLLCELRGRNAYGAPLARAARALRAFRDVPLVVLTSRVGASDRLAAAACGASEFLSKPADLHALLGAVQRAAGGATIEPLDDARTPSHGAARLHPPLRPAPARAAG